MSTTILQNYGFGTVPDVATALIFAHTAIQNGANTAPTATPAINSTMLFSLC